jgi:hypothetical protein
MAERQEALLKQEGRGLTRLAMSALILGAAIVLLSLGLRSWTRVADLQLHVADMEPKGGYAFEVNLRRALPWPLRPISDNLFALYRSDLVLFEDGRRLGPARGKFQDIQSTGAGSYMHWGRGVVFSAADNSDPRVNGREYTVKVTAGVSPDVLQAVGLLGTGVVVLGGLLHARVRRRALRQALEGARAHIWRRAGQYLLALSVPAVISLLQLAFLPAIWNGSDSTIWLLWQWTWIPHHPPVYPAFMALANGLFDETSRVVGFSIAIQHLALTLSIGYLASAHRENWKIVIVSAFASLGSALSLYSHGLFTEGLALPFLILFLGAVLRLPREGCTVPVMVTCVTGLLGAASTRHALLLFGVIPVSYFFLAALFSRERVTAAAWKPFGLAVLATGSAAVGSSLLTHYSCLLLDADCTSILGRAGVYRLQDAYGLLGAKERERWLDKVKERAGDPQVASAIDYMAKVPNAWTGPRDAIAADRMFDAQNPDRLLNAGYKTFAFSLDGAALRQWRGQIEKALLGVGANGYCPGQFTCLLESSAFSIESVYPADRRTLEAAAGTSAVDSAAANAYRKLGGSSVAGFLDALLPLTPRERALLLGMAVAIAVIAIALGPGSQFVALIASLWAGFITYVVGMTFITVVLPRYIAPLDVIIWLSNAIALIALLDSAVARRAASTEK